jgi:hypothetical protein
MHMPRCRAVIEDLSTMLGRRILVGITYVDVDGQPEHKVQFAGIVTAIDPLVTIDRGDDEPFTLPPDPDAYDQGAPGEYRLRGTGDVVVNPDFITTWTVQAPSSSDDE